MLKWALNQRSLAVSRYRPHISSLFYHAEHLFSRALRPRCKLHMHWIRSREMSPIAPAMHPPNVIPPIGKCLFERITSGIVLCVPIDGNPVGMERETRAGCDLSEVETTCRLVQSMLMQP